MPTEIYQNSIILTHWGRCADVWGGGEVEVEMGGGVRAPGKGLWARRRGWPARCGRAIFPPYFSQEDHTLYRCVHTSSYPHTPHFHTRRLDTNHTSGTAFSADDYNLGYSHAKFQVRGQGEVQCNAGCRAARGRGEVHSTQEPGRAGPMAVHTLVSTFM